nr:MAG TPA_asm: hypothetical protein [Caudoviricetes sp.]
MHRCNHINIDLVSSYGKRTKHTKSILLNCCRMSSFRSAQK